LRLVASKDSIKADLCRHLSGLTAFAAIHQNAKLLVIMPTLEQTTQEVLNLAATHFKLQAGTLAPEDDFFKKLGIDSLQTLELLSRIENHFGIELPDYEVQGVSDFKTLAERIQSRL
jgi:acyl carrier protein